MSEPRLYIQITRRRETSGIGDSVEIDGHVYRVVAMEASTPVTDASMDLDADRGDIIVSYQIEYVRPAPKRRLRTPAARPAPSPAPPAADPEGG